MTTVVKYATESVAKLSGKKKKTRLKVRDHGQEEGDVSDKSTIQVVNMSEFSHEPSKREECGINILILA